MTDDPSLPVLTPIGLNGKGILMQSTEGGHLVPLFMGGCSPEKFLVDSGLSPASPMLAFDTIEKFREFVRQVVINPETFQIKGFVFNPAKADLTQYTSAGPFELFLKLEEL